MSGLKDRYGRPLPCDKDWNSSDVGYTAKGDIQAFMKNKIWLLENFGDVQINYAGQYVAIKDKEVVGSDTNIPDLKDKVDSYIVIEYIPTEYEEDQPMIL